MMFSHFSSTHRDFRQFKRKRLQYSMRGHADPPLARAVFSSQRPLSPLVAVRTLPSRKTARRPEHFRRFQTPSPVYLAVGMIVSGMFFSQAGANIASRSRGRDLKKGKRTATASRMLRMGAAPSASLKS